MVNQTITKKEKSLDIILEELREVNKNLRKFLLIIPEESLKEYKNASEIKKSLAMAIKIYPSK